MIATHQADLPWTGFSYLPKILVEEDTLGVGGAVFLGEVLVHGGSLEVHKLDLEEPHEALLLLLDLLPPQVQQNSVERDILMGNTFPVEITEEPQEFLRNLFQQQFLFTLEITCNFLPFIHFHFQE